MPVVGRIIDGVYVRFDGSPEAIAQRHRSKGDYFHGVRESDLTRLDSRQLYEAAVRLGENRVGTRDEQANAAEASAAVVRERFRRQATIR